MDLMPIMLGDLSEPQRAFLDKALTAAYKKKGILLEDPESWNNKPPIMKDLQEVLEYMEKKVTALEKPTIRSLITRVSLYVSGVFSFLNQHTNLNFNNQFVCFDIGSMPKQVKPAIMFLVLDYVYMKMKENLERKLLVIDEAWSLLSRTEDASYVFEIVKTCRKFNLALFLINQEVGGMLASEAGKSVLANSSYTLLMRQKPAVIASIRKTFYLSDAEEQRLLTAGVGEGILILDDDHSEIRIVASPEEHKIITTNPDELLASEKPRVMRKKKKPVRKQKEVTVDIDKSRGFYYRKRLSKEEILYLLSEGYREETFNSFIFQKKEKCLFKPRRGESKQHGLLVHEIAAHLQDYLALGQLPLSGFDGTTKTPSL